MSYLSNKERYNFKRRLLSMRLEELFMSHIYNLTLIYSQLMNRTVRTKVVCVSQMKGGPCVLFL